MKEYPDGMPWLIVRLKGQSFALPIREVRELIMKPQITAVPETPAFVRGVINIRGQVLPVIDLRQRLGMTPVTDESDAFCPLMDQRRQDHVNWLNELEASSRERREFKLATDPHQCAFGRWYDAYHTDNVWIANLLRRFAEAHKQVHATAGAVLASQSQGDWEGAMSRIEQTRANVLATMITLFGHLQDLIRDTMQEVAVVLQADNRTFAVAVDEALAVEKFEPGNRGHLPVTAEDGVVAEYGSRGKANPLVLMISTDRLFESICPCSHRLTG